MIRIHCLGKSLVGLHLSHGGLFDPYQLVFGVVVGTWTLPSSASFSLIRAAKALSELWVGMLLMTDNHERLQV